MIWYNENVQINNYNVKIIGTYENAVINISLELNGNNVIIFNKVIKSMAYEDPTSDDIYNKYVGKISKIKQNLTDLYICKVFSLHPDL